MVKVGQKVKCWPFFGNTTFEAELQTRSFEAVVTQVNESHRWFQVEYGDDKNVKKMRICYNFNDIGNTVQLV